MSAAGAAVAMPAKRGSAAARNGQQHLLVLPVDGTPKSFAETLSPLQDRRTWELSLYYFLTFGGFVAMAIYLPIFLTEMFHLTPHTAEQRTAGFVVRATAMRPLGGVLADRFGGRGILKWGFPFTGRSEERCV